jgi:transposase InsO family protein
MVRHYRFKLSPGTVGDCFDNVMIESFQGKIQTQRLNHEAWTSQVELIRAMAG